MEKFISEFQGGRMTMNQLKGNASIFMIAGSETTATTLAHCVYRLLMNPKIFSKLTSEIRDKFSSAQEISLANVNQCKYLHCVLEETLRITPPSPATHPRYTPPEGAEIDGYYIPGDMVIGVPIYAAARSSLNFRDADKFVPERWSGEDPRYDEDRRDGSQVFSVGPRDCKSKISMPSHEDSA
jgi:cytochrome P450